MLSLFPRDVLDEILNLNESVFEGSSTYSCIHITSDSPLLMDQVSVDLTLKTVLGTNLFLQQEHRKLGNLRPFPQFCKK